MGVSKRANLLRQEDWLAVWIGFIVIAVGCVAVLTGWFDFSAMKFSTWSWGEAEAVKAVALGDGSDMIHEHS